MKHSVLTLAFVALLSLPAFAYAQGFVPLTSVPAFKEITGEGGLSGFLNQLYILCVGAAAVIAVIQLVRAGMLYSLSDSFTEKKEAKHIITMSLLGLILVLSPTIVFGIINPAILELRIDTSNLGGINFVDIEDPDQDGMNKLCIANHPEFTKYASIITSNDEETCLSVKGSGWVDIAGADRNTGLIVGDGACCWGSAWPSSQGSKCCAYDPSKVSTPRPEPTGSYTYSADSVRVRGGVGEWCKDDSYGSRFEDAAACISDVNQVLGRPVTEDIVYVHEVKCSGVPGAPTDTLASDAALKARVDERRAAYTQKVAELGGDAAIPWCN